jgi:hypothetical protein
MAKEEQNYFAFIIQSIYFFCFGIKMLCIRGFILVLKIVYIEKRINFIVLR